MIKKMILMLLVLVGGVMSANAAKLYINIDNVSWWSSLRVYAWGDGDNNNNGWRNQDNGIIATTTSRFGKDWYVFDLENTTYHSAIIQQG